MKPLTRGTFMPSKMAAIKNRAVRLQLVRSRIVTQSLSLSLFCLRRTALRPAPPVQTGARDRAKRLGPLGPPRKPVPLTGPAFALELALFWNVLAPALLELLTRSGPKFCLAEAAVTAGADLL